MKSSVLLISGIYPPDMGGPATFTQDFSRWLAHKDVNILVVTYTDGPSNTVDDEGV